MSTDPLQKYRNAAVKFVKEASLKEFGLMLELEPEVASELADFAFPCFVPARRVGVKPAELAERLSLVPADSTIHVSSSSGYLNVNADAASLASDTVQLIEKLGEEYGVTEPTGLRILVEHTSVNPNGPIHIGRARNAMIGDTIVRCLKKSGEHVSSEYYVNDLGRQVITLLWGMKHLQCANGEERRADYALLPCYIQASEMMEKDSKCASEIAEMQRSIEGGKTALIHEVREMAGKVLSGIRESLSAVGVSHDSYFFESRLLESGAVTAVVEGMRSLPEARQEEGAWYIPVKAGGAEEKFYFTRSDGTTLYTTRDIAYHLDKLSRGERMIDVLGEDQRLGATFLLSSLRKLRGDPQIDFVFHSYVVLEEGKMATRKGNVVLLDDVVKEAISRAGEEVRKRREGISAAEVDRIAGIVGPGAVRFNVVRLQPEKKIIFRWQDALNFEGSSAPFIQYAHARACSILNKAEGWKRQSGPYTEHEELLLAKRLAYLPSLLRVIRRTLAVHSLAQYALHLASDFNQFYRVVPVLRAPEELRDARLTLVDASRIVMKNTLWCLGIEAPENM